MFFVTLICIAFGFWIASTLQRDGYYYMSIFSYIMTFVFGIYMATTL